MKALAFVSSSLILVKAAIFMCLFLTSSCASKKHTVTDLVDTGFEKTAHTAGGEIGLNADKQVVFKKNSSLESELYTAAFVNNSLHDKVSLELHELESCREDLSDPRLGGSGHVNPVPELHDRDRSFTSEEIGIDEDGSLKVVKRKFVLVQLKAERSEERKLRSLLKVSKRHNKECQRKLKRARVQAGLPAEKIRAAGAFSKAGVWTQTRRGEKSLDDAFALIQSGGR